MHLDRLENVLNAEIDRGGLPGAVLGIVKDGELTYLRAFGQRDPAAGAPMTTDTVFWLASMTKPVTTVGALLLTEQGRLPLDAPIERFLPEFADRRVGTDRVPVNRQPTVLDLLRHTSGIVEGWLGDTAVHRLYVEAVDDGMTAYTGAEFASRLAALPLLHEPGVRWHYGWGLDLIGLIIERITGRTLGDYLTAAVFEPLGMADTTFGRPDPGRYAAAFPVDPGTGSPVALPDLGRAAFDSGGAGLVGTVPDYLRFVRLLLAGGRLDSVRLLGRKTVEFMTADQLPPGTDTSALERLEPGHGFGLGVAVRRGVAGAPTPGSPGEYTWGGVGGTYWWADPRERLGVVYGAHHPHPRTSDAYHRLIRTLVLSALD